MNEEIDLRHTSRELSIMNRLMMIDWIERSYLKLMILKYFCSVHLYSSPLLKLCFNSNILCNIVLLISWLIFIVAHCTCLILTTLYWIVKLYYVWCVTVESCFITKSFASTQLIACVNFRVAWLCFNFLLWAKVFGSTESICAVIFSLYTKY